MSREAWAASRVTRKYRASSDRISPSSTRQAGQQLERVPAHRQARGPGLLQFDVAFAEVDVGRAGRQRLLFFRIDNKAMGNSSSL
ncbi:MAG: hypothetical protein MZV65_12700 [Chromatiales bacterium]|nr:hypothetical protein [Chromatiales bacterium]